MKTASTHCVSSFFLTCPSTLIPQHPSEERYHFSTPSTMKPTQVSCSEGSINQIPPWTEIQGDIRLTPFYNVYDCMKKVEGYVKELNDGKSCDFHSNQLCDHVLHVISNWYCGGDLHNIPPPPFIQILPSCLREAPAVSTS